MMFAHLARRVFPITAALFAANLASSQAAGLPPPPASHAYADDVAWITKNCSNDASVCTGDQHLVVAPATSDKPEFPASTRILFLDANGTAILDALRDAKAFADTTQSPVELYYTRTAGNSRTFNAGQAYALADLIESEVAANHDLHFVAFRSGAGLANFALRFAADALKTPSAAGAPPLSHVGIETYENEALDWPTGVRAVQYVEPGKPPVVSGP